MTAGEVAAVLGVHPDTMARKIRDGVLPLKRVRWSSSKRPKYLTADVERVVRRRLYT
jgi:excisionase family DNA binding protein